MKTKMKTERKVFPMRLDPEDLDRMRSIQRIWGIPVAEQCRRAVKMWLTNPPPAVKRFMTQSGR